MKVVINDVVYVPKKKSELDLLKEKYESRDYICIRGETHYQTTKYLKVNDLSQFSFGNFKLIHKKHKDILDAYLADNNVEIECIQDISSLCSNPTEHVFKVDNFINEYKEYFDYKIKPKQQYPIFKRNENGEVFKITNDKLYSIVLSKNSENIGEVIYYCNSLLNSYETIPFDEERGLYHLQPVWIQDSNFKAIDFYDVNNKRTQIHYISDKSIYSIEPITPEQLKVMPFVWKMYQQVLKDKQ